jgi:hypothetical protein
VSFRAGMAMPAPENVIFYVFKSLKQMKFAETARYRPSTIFAMMLCWISFEPA